MAQINNGAQKVELVWEVCSSENLPNDMEEVLVFSGEGRGVKLCDFNVGMEGDTASYFQPDGGYIYSLEDIQFWARVPIPKEGANVPGE